MGFGGANIYVFKVYGKTQLIMWVFGQTGSRLLVSNEFQTLSCTKRAWGTVSVAGSNERVLASWLAGADPSDVY